MNFFIIFFLSYALIYIDADAVVHNPGRWIVPQTVIEDVAMWREENQAMRVQWHPP